MRILFLSVLLVLESTASAAIRYVTENGAGNMDGSSWNNAWPGTDLQGAIDAAGPGDELWVACGTYQTTSGTDRSAAFSMKNGVSIYGSFEGTETSLNERAITCGPCSLLTGEIGAPGNTDNSYQVIRNQGLNATAILDGFVISDANDDRAPTLTEGLGGGILNIGSGAGGSCSPVIRNCVIVNNCAEFGAGIFNDGFGGGEASPLIDHCILTGNLAYGGGGGIDNFGLGGAADPVIANCLITGNTAQDAAGAIYCWGGNNGSASPQIVHSTISGNTVINGAGGGIIADRSNGGGGTNGGSGTVNIFVVNSIITGNTALTGPQFYTYESGAVSATYSTISAAGQVSPHVSQGPNTENNALAPAFLNELLPAGADGCWMTTDDGYSLSTGSPCINTGNNSWVAGLDLAFNPRISETQTDRGAYEFPSTSSLEEPATGSFRLFPNPAHNELTIVSDKPGEMVLEDAHGKILQKISLIEGQTTADLSELAPGTYFARHLATGEIHAFVVVH